MLHLQDPTKEMLAIHSIGIDEKLQVETMFLFRMMTPHELRKSIFNWVFEKENLYKNFFMISTVKISKKNCP